MCTRDMYTCILHYIIFYYMLYNIYIYIHSASRGMGCCRVNGRLSGALHMIWPHVIRSTLEGLDHPYHAGARSDPTSPQRQTVMLYQQSTVASSGEQWCTRLVQGRVLPAWCSMVAWQAMVRQAGVRSCPTSLAVNGGKQSWATLV